MFQFLRLLPLRFLVACAFSLSSLAPAEEILFIGNSFTHGHDPRLSQHGGLPAVFETIARAKGKDVNVTMVAPSGKDWGFHLKNKNTLQALKNKEWDKVVIQDYSTKPTHIGNKKAFFKDGIALSKLIWESSPQATVVLYRTWARQPGNEMYSTPEKKSSFKDFDQMDEELAESYGSLFKKLNTDEHKRQVLLAPVGDAFALSVKTLPDTNLYAEDLYHAAPVGSYLAALVFYSTIYGDSSIDAIHEFSTFKVDKSTAGELQNIAETLRRSPPGS